MSLNVFAQDLQDYEKSPVFPECESVSIQDLKTCFNQQVAQFVYHNFIIPQIVTDDNYNGNIVVLFEVGANGNFVVLYVDAIYNELKTEANRVFAALPKIKPATYNGRPTYKQYSYTIKIPLEAPNNDFQSVAIKKESNVISEIERQAKTEYDSINASIKSYEDLEYKSQLNIPFVHNTYARFDRNMNLLGTNSHTASKPYIFMRKCQNIMILKQRKMNY